ncbi:nucleotide-sugar transporter [Trichoderma cornu-damae]|uniref:Nucleotide-sugar transporter n=1 Tax=Trichoderma cornu-damae TaxID=654480 RepID=A0A9P8QM23_9HYPO|nr:nucleotide-sugar transporter [Trichoderma cornu-damae]
MSSSRSSSPPPAAQPHHPLPHPHLRPHPHHPQPQPQHQPHPYPRPRRRSSVAIDAAFAEPFPDVSPAVVAAAAAAGARGEGASTSTSTPTSPYTPTGTISASAVSSQVGGRPGDSAGIEMEPIVGHRRRKSSAMNPFSQPQTAPGKPVAAGGSGRKHLSAGLPDRSDVFEENGGSSSASTGSGNDEEARGRASFSDEDLHSDEETGLSNKERARRQKRRRRITQLGQRIARDKSLSAEERQEADKDVVRRLLVNLVLILLWYFFSLSISLYNKWMFDRDRLNFAFPLFTTSMHMVVQFVLSALVLYFIPSLRPQRSHTSDMGRSRHETEASGSVMSKMFYLTRVGPCGAATGLDIGLGNTSLKFISLTFYTMCKSSSLAFVLLFAFAFRLEKPTWRLVAIIATMTLGVILMVFGEVEFKLGGFVLVIAAAFFSGFRWGLTQILLLRNPATSNPFSSIFFLTPVMFLTLVSIAIPVEGFGPLWEGLKALGSEWGTFMTPLFLLFPGCIAFLMTASEFALLQRTSVVTLSIAGIFKEVVTISAASLVFKDRLTLVNFIGLITTMLAIIAYNYIKIKKMREDAQVQVHVRVTDVDAPSASASDFENDDSAEETAGLLQQNVERGEAPVTSDGDVQPNGPQTFPHHDRAASKDRKPRRDD